MRLPRRAGPTYANVVSTLALFIALGGTGYAAYSLPRDSVGARELRSGSVGHAELRKDAVSSGSVRDGSLSIRDFSATARGALTGGPGPAGPAGATGSKGDPGARGPQGATGPAGPSPATDWAAIDSGGARVAGTATAASNPGFGQFVVSFAHSVAGCATVATLARIPSGPNQDPPAGRITVSATGDGTVLVRTYDASGVLNDFGFNLIVVCS